MASARAALLADLATSRRASLDLAALFMAAAASARTWRHAQPQWRVVLIRRCAGGIGVGVSESSGGVA